MFSVLREYALHILFRTKWSEDSEWLRKLGFKSSVVWNILCLKSIECFLGIFIRNGKWMEFALHCCTISNINFTNTNIHKPHSIWPRTSYCQYTPYFPESTIVLERPHSGLLWMTHCDPVSTGIAIYFTMSYCFRYRFAKCAWTCKRVNNADVPRTWVDKAQTMHMRSVAAVPRSISIIYIYILLQYRRLCNVIITVHLQFGQSSCEYRPNNALTAHHHGAARE